ncbi:hypothetical protein ACNOYE_07690 [Nannocystaceae bacterium ST9]
MTRWLPVGASKPASPIELELVAPAEAWPHRDGPAAGTGRTRVPLAIDRRAAWATTLPEGPRVSELRAIGGRVLALREPDPLGRQTLELLDDKGQHLRTIVGLAGDWAIDPRGVLLGRTIDRELAAWTLDQPERPPAFVSARFDARELIATRVLGDRLLVITRQPRTLQRQPDLLIDMLRIPDHAQVSRWRSLKIERLAERIAELCDRAVLGFDAAGPLLASEGELAWFDWQLGLRARVDCPLRVIALAPRSDARTWLLAERAGKPELWKIGPGVCERVIALEPALTDANAILVAPDDAAVLVSSTRIACFDERGEPRWTFARRGRATGIVDPRGTTLVGHDAKLIAVDSTGKFSPVWTAPGDVAELGPIAAASGMVWVGAGSRLFALA